MKKTIKIRKKDAKKMLRATGYGDVQEMLVAALNIGLNVLMERRAPHMSAGYVNEEPSA